MSLAGRDEAYGEEIGRVWLGGMDAVERDGLHESTV